MSILPIQPRRTFLRPHWKKLSRAFSTIELVIVLAVGMIMAAISIPLVQSTLKDLRLRSCLTPGAAPLNDQPESHRSSP